MREEAQQLVLLVGEVDGVVAEADRVALLIDHEIAAPQQRLAGRARRREQPGDAQLQLGGVDRRSDDVADRDAGPDEVELRTLADREHGHAAPDLGIAQQRREAARGEADAEIEAEQGRLKLARGDEPALERGFHTHAVAVLAERGLRGRQVLRVVGDE